MSCDPDLQPDYLVAPVEGSPARTRPGFRAAPADLDNAGHYPVEAICAGCRMIIRAEHRGGGWLHTGRRPGQ